MLIDDWDSLSAEDVVDAVENQVPEGREIEYKRELDVTDDNHKQTFVGEVCSFANTDGGDLIIGIQEANGSAGILYPFECENMDDLINRWVQIISSNTDPQILQRYVDIKTVEINQSHSEYVAADVPETGYVLVVRVIPSHYPLHQETISSTFYERSASGKSPLATSEVQRLLSTHDEFEQELKDLLTTRIESIQSNDVDTKVRQDYPLAVLHIFSRSTFDRSVIIDPNAAHVDSPHNSDQAYPPLLRADGISPGAWYDFDGERYISGAELPQYEAEYGHQVFSAYTRTHRDGYIEAVSDSIGRLVHDHPEYPHHFVVDGSRLRQMLEGSLEQYVQFLNQEDVEFPLYCSLTLLNTDDLAFGLGFRTSMTDQRRRLSDDLIRLPREVIASSRNDIARHVDELMDNAFRLAGYPEEPRV